MSENSLCNYCIMLNLKRRAAQGKKELITKEEDGGVAVYIGGKCVVWFAELPAYCVC